MSVRFLPAASQRHCLTVNGGLLDLRRVSTGDEGLGNGDGQAGAQVADFLRTPKHGQCMAARRAAPLRPYLRASLGRGAAKCAPVDVVAGYTRASLPAHRPHAIVAVRAEGVAEPRIVLLVQLALQGLAHAPTWQVGAEWGAGGVLRVGSPPLGRGTAPYDFFAMVLMWPASRQRAPSSIHCGADRSTRDALCARKCTAAHARQAGSSPSKQAQLRGVRELQVQCTAACGQLTRRGQPYLPCSSWHTPDSTASRTSQVEAARGSERVTCRGWWRASAWQLGAVRELVLEHRSKLSDRQSQTRKPPTSPALAASSLKGTEQTRPAPCARQRCRIRAAVPAASAGE